MGIYLSGNGNVVSLTIYTWEIPEDRCIYVCMYVCMYVKYLVRSGDVVWLPRFLTRDGDLP